MQTLEYVRICIHDLLVIISGTYDDPPEEVKVALDCLRFEKLRVNDRKSNFGLHEITHLGYVLLRDCIKPQTEKVSAILALGEPQNVK